MEGAPGDLIVSFPSADQPFIGQYSQAIFDLSG